MKLERSICFLDTETTGLNPITDRIIEFAAVVLNPDGTRSEWVQRFNPGIPILSEATEIHHITDADVADCPPFSAHARQINLALQGKDLGGYNLRRFDLQILDTEMRRCGMKLNMDGVHVIDCYGIFAKRESRKLEDAVRRYCGREHVDAHGSLADAGATADVFWGQLQAYPDLAAMDLSTLAEFSQADEVKYADLAGKLYYDGDGHICYAFGQHKDCKVKDQIGFAKWCLSKDFHGSTKDVLLSIVGPDSYRW